MAEKTHTQELIINYVPGEECRVAVMKDGKLDEFHSERTAAVSHVGNIYVGRVVNVEPAISAAFVDFGLEHNGFLHVSDLHPRYFGEKKSAKERVGKKTPRRERPPIQDALKRGQEVIVQVLKEGVGSKGPTLTSYLSIPGRYLVMMPNMDKVGVSRKVEDEETRAKMKAILDQLELPEGFGFILRTAGFDRSKTELKKDLAYLQRLWKDMEKRRKAGGKPRLLYSESDLLVRALRDMLTTEVERVVIDHELAIKRAARFIKIVSPRTVTKLVHYTGKAPIFHALGVETQIRTMYAREVPLPSGGRLVIDETEALVAIDVNSGKSRAAGDSEENAYRTNLEAAEEIVRQLRLRDMGGIVVNDLIDMRLARHRKEVERKFEDLLAEDRAKSTITPISEFGILEMTRQRMRGSHESMHFHECPTCHGRGLVQRVDSVAADAMRELAALLDHAVVAKAEMVVNPRVAGELLSSRRKTLSRIERQFGKPVAIRLSDATPLDRVTFYAYDDQGADIEIERLPRPRVGDGMLVPYEEPGVTDVPPEEDDGWAMEPSAEAPPAEHDDLNDEGLMPAELHPIEMDLPLEPTAPLRGRPPAGGQAAGPADGPPLEGDGEGRRGRRRRGRRGRRGRGPIDGPDGPGNIGPDGDHPPLGPGAADAPAFLPGNAAHAGDLVAGSIPPGGEPGPGHEGADRSSPVPQGETDGRPFADPARPTSDGPEGPGGFGPGPDGPFTDGEGGRRRRRRRRGRRGRGDLGPDGDGFGPDAGPRGPMAAGEPAFAGGPGGMPGSPAPLSGPPAGPPGGPPPPRNFGSPPSPRGHVGPNGPGQRWGPGGAGGGGGGRDSRPPHSGPARPGFDDRRSGPRPPQGGRFEGLAGAFRADALRAAPPGPPDGPPPGSPPDALADIPARDDSPNRAGGPLSPDDAHGSDGPYLPDGPEGPGGPGGPGVGEVGGRRRRRRGGRGRNRGGEGGGADFNQGAPRGPAPIGDRPARPLGGPPPVRPPSRPTAPPPPPSGPSAPQAGAPGSTPAGPPKPRVLYSQYRRLRPGEKPQPKRE